MDTEPRSWPPARTPTLALALATGIAGSAATGPFAAAAAPWLAACALVLLATPWRRLGARGRALACLAVALLGGASLAALERGAPPTMPASAVIDDREDDVVVGVVVGPVLAVPGRTQFVVDLDASDARVLVSVPATDDPAADALHVAPLPGAPAASALHVAPLPGDRAVDALHAAPLPGDRIRVTGRLRSPRGYRNPGGVDRVQIVRDRGADAELTAETVTITEVAARPTAWRWAARVHRDAVAAIAARVGDADGKAIVRAAVVGDRSAVTEATDAAWRGAGIYHALSVSGLHLAVVALLLFAAARRVAAAIPALAIRCAPARVAAVAAVPAAIGYTLVTGGQTATIRALIAVLAIVAGAALRRRLVVLDAVGLAAIAILVQRPSALGDPAFQLSFTAAVTLCVVARARRDDLEVAPARWPWRVARAVGRWGATALRTSAWVTATTAPITAWHFHEVAVGGVVGNLFLSPAIELLVIPLGLAGLALGGISDIGGIGDRLVDLAVVIAAWVDDGARAVAAVVPVLEVAPPRFSELVGWAAILVGLAVHARTSRGTRARRQALALVGAGALLGAAAVAWSWTAPARRDELRVTFLDVGQGDAAVIELPGGAVWLIDAGGAPVRASDDIPPEAARRAQRAPGEALRRYLVHQRIGRIDVAVVSHPHPDHYLGLVVLAGTIPIDELWIAKPPPGALSPAAGSDLPTFDEVATALVAHGTRIVHPPLGVARRDGGATLEVLAPVFDDGAGPAPIAAVDPVRSVNDDSVVVAIAYRGRRILFLGDLEEEGEDRLVARGGIAADVVKVAHHGSATSSTEPLVAASRARWAVISCGRANRFGFPAADVVHRWEDAGVDVLRTDQRGAVTVTVTRAGDIDVATND